MTSPFLTLLVTIAMMLAMAMTLILKPKALRRFNGAAIFFAGIVGLLFYGFGYGTEIHSLVDLLIAAIHAVKDTISMFTGGDSYSSLVSSAPWFAENMWLQVLYWFAVLAAMYFTAAVVLGALGKRFLRFLRSLVIRYRKEIVVFYPTSDKQVALAAEISRDNNITPLFIGECGSDKLQDKIDNIAGVVWEDDVVSADGKWLEKLGLCKDEKKEIKLFAAGESDSKTKKFLKKVLTGMEKKGLTSMRVTMTVLCDDEQEFTFLTGKQKDGYYLQADICSYKNMTAKMLTKAVAPWECVEFKENGEVSDAFSAMIIGFGQVGQSVLCELVRNSQFVGKKTKLQVVDKNYKEKAGAFLSIYKEMLAYYDVEFLEVDVFSEEFFNLLAEEKSSHAYVALCMGDDEKNQEAASQIRFFRNRKNGNFRRDMVIATCSKNEIIFYDEQDRTIAIPDPQDLWAGTLDDEAKEIHKVYVKGKAKALYPDDPKKQADFYKASWYENDYSSRLSCDASATFIPAMYKAAGIAADEKHPKRSLTALFKEKPELLETLSQMEHLRWNAFSYSMGVTPMPLSEFENRVKKAMDDIREDVEKLEKGNVSASEGKASIDHIHAACKYVRKELDADGFGGVHVCITDWDVLDESWAIYEPLASTLARAEYAYALLCWKENGGQGQKPELEKLSEFKQLDINNVMNLMDEN